MSYTHKTVNGLVIELTPEEIAEREAQDMAWAASEAERISLEAASSNTEVISSVKLEKTLANLKKTIESMDEGAQKTAMLAIVTLLEGE